MLTVTLLTAIPYLLIYKLHYYFKFNVKKHVLTVQPFRVVLKGALEGELLATGGQVVQVRPEDDGVRFRELRVGPGVESGQVSRIPFLDPNRRRIVGRVVRTLCYAHPDTGHVSVPAQVRQVRLQDKN